MKKPKRMANNLEIAVKSSAAVAGLRKYDSATDKSITKTKRFDKSIGRLDGQLTKTGSTAATVGRLFGGLFAGISALVVIRSATKAMATFEETMAVVRGVTGASAENFKRLENVAKELGSTTRFSATQAGEGLLFLARAGFTTNEAVAAIPATLKFAQGSMLDLGTAADIVSNILTQFGLAAEETAKAGNILVNTANSANTNVQQLAEAMKFVGPIAGSLGISLEETAASIGVLGDSGIQASMAGTSLRMALLRLIKPTTEAKDAMAGLGLTVEDLNPTTNTLADIFLKLRKANLGAIDSLKIFGVRSAASILQLSRNANRVKELTQANREATDVLDRMAALMDDTLSGAFLSLKSAIEATFLSVGDQGLTGGLKDLTQTAADAIRILLGMEEQLKGDTAAAEKLAVAIQLVGIALASTAIAGAGQLLIGISKSLGLATIASILFTKEVAGTTIRITLLTRVMKTLNFVIRRNPFISIVTGISAVIGAFLLFRNKAEETTISTEELAKSADELADSYKKGVENLEGMVAAQEALNIARVKGDLSGQVAALKIELGLIEKRKKAILESRDPDPEATKIFKRMARRSGTPFSELVEQGFIPPLVAPDLSKLDDFQKLILKNLEEQANIKSNLGELTALEIAQKEKSFKLDEASVKLIDKELASRKKINIAAEKAASKARIRLDDLLDGLKFERDLIGKTNVERETAITLQNARNIAEKGGIELSVKRERQLRETIIELNRAEKLIDIGNQVGESFSHAFLDMATGAASARESIRLLIQEISRLVLKQTIADPLARVVSSFATNIASSLFAGPAATPVSTGRGGFSLTEFNRSFDTPAFIPGFSTPNFNVNIENNSSVPISTGNVSTEFDGRSFVTNIVLEDLNNRGAISTAIGAR